MCIGHLQTHPGMQGLKGGQNWVQMGMWAMFSAPLLMSNDLRKLHKADRDLLLDPTLIAINQDALGEPLPPSSPHVDTHEMENCEPFFGPHPIVETPESRISLACHCYANSTSEIGENAPWYFNPTVIDFYLGLSCTRSEISLIWVIL
jgi:hypothetical protein